MLSIDDISSTPPSPPPRDLRDKVELLHDPLTGLCNKHGFITLGNRRLPLMAAGGRRPTVIYIELNEYEGLISRLGFDESIDLLRMVRCRLEMAFGSDMLLARFDSERFAVLLPDACPDIEALLHVLEVPLHLREATVHLSVTCGVASYPEAADNMDTLVIAARTARREALRAGQRVGHFAQALRQRLARQRAIEDGLWFCRGGKGMSLLYQPKIDIRAGRVFGVEALLRWQHPDLGAISPAEFIPLAEGTRTIVPIGEWILREALRQKSAWRRAGQDMCLSLNVSPLQLQPNNCAPSVLEVLIEECDRLGLERGKIELELTKGVLTDPVIMQEILLIIRAGFRIAIDDFGREHSTLSLLADCPAHTLKIDKSFVDNVVENKRQLAIVQFIVALARRLGMQTVVEGIEHLQQLVVLADAGCDYGQGYFYYRPLSGAQILDLRHQN